METTPTDGVPVRRKRQPRKQKITIPIDASSQATFEGVGSTMAAFAAAVGELYRSVMAAQKQGFEVRTFVLTRRDRIAHQQATTY